jgi:DNA helicase-2/ATP-dependent DNA helicase PcrA
VRGASAAVAASEVAGEIEWAKARLVGPEEYEGAATLAHREPPRPAEEIAELYARYEREKSRRRLLDFDDLIWHCAHLIEQDAEFAAVQRWRFRHLYVDEFQDITPAQARLVRGWLGTRDDLCVVGDPDQSIYAFAGADASHLTAFAKRFGGGKVVRLDCNYRSTQQVVTLAEALLADGERGRRPRRAVRDGGSVPTITAYDTDHEEAVKVAERVRDAHGPNIPWSAIAVLYRTNAQSAHFEEAFGRLGIPYRVRGDGRFLERPEVKSALERIRKSAVDAPGRSFVDHVADLEADAANASAEQHEHAEALVRLAREYAELGQAHGETGPNAVAGFTAYLMAALRGDAPDTGSDAVELLTFHRAKGLEFHTVFVTGLERGLVPISHAELPQDRAEERRLLYVAVTRAEHDLHLSYARERTFGMRASRRAPSPWLAPMQAALDSTKPTAKPAAADRVASARAALADATNGEARDELPADRALLDALREWRRNLARASGVPAFVIFHDTTLKAVAMARPATRDALLEVPGIGPIKAERHGDAVLDLVHRHAS